MEELVLRYGMPPDYICSVPSLRKYVSTTGSLEIGVYEETFKARFRILVHPFMEELLYRYELMLFSKPYA